MRTLFLFILLTLSSQSYASSSELLITLTKEKTQLSFPQAQRLDAVLKETMKYSNITAYPLGLQLADDSKLADIERDKMAIINQLNELSTYSPLLSWQETPYQKKALQLSQQLKPLSLVSRLFIPLDYDLVRIKKAVNPILKGHYSLVSPKRPNTVMILGNINTSTPLTRPYIENGQLSDYLKPLDNNASIAYVIQPDGVVQMMSDNLWQQNTTSIAPGATIFIGFADLPSDFSTLNNDIAQLLRNKVN